MGSVNIRTSSGISDDVGICQLSYSVGVWYVRSVPEYTYQVGDSDISSDVYIQNFLIHPTLSFRSKIKI